MSTHRPNFKREPAANAIFIDEGYTAEADIASIEDEVEREELITQLDKSGKLKKPQRRKVSEHACVIRPARGGRVGT